MIYAQMQSCLIHEGPDNEEGTFKDVIEQAGRHKSGNIINSSSAQRRLAEMDSNTSGWILAASTNRINAKPNAAISLHGPLVSMTQILFPLFFIGSLYQLLRQEQASMLG